LVHLSLALAIFLRPVLVLVPIDFVTINENKTGL